jgi:hypothetical protein
MLADRASILTRGNERISSLHLRAKIGTVANSTFSLVDAEGLLPQGKLPAHEAYQSI